MCNCFSSVLAGTTLLYPTFSRRALRRKQRADTTPGADPPTSSSGAEAVGMLEESARSISQDDSDIRKGPDRYANYIVSAPGSLRF